MIITLKLELHETETKGDMFKKMGLLAEAFEDNDVEIIEFSEQKVSTDAAAPKKRKARGPNKPKPVEVVDVQPVDEKAAADIKDIPESLRRTA